MKSLPRYEEVGTLNRPGQFRRPLPQRLYELIGAKAAEHDALGERHDEASGRVTALTAELAKEQRADAARERQALATGAKVPAQKAPKVSEQLIEAERQLAVLGDVLRESATELLQAAVPHVAAAKAQAEEAEEAALAASERLAAESLAALERANELAGEVGWYVALELRGIVAAGTGRKADVSPRARGALSMVAGLFEEDRYQLEQRRAHTEREVYAKEKLPPGQRVWREGQEFVADEKGEL